MDRGHIRELRKTPPYDVTVSQLLAEPFAIYSLRPEILVGEMDKDKYFRTEGVVVYSTRICGISWYVTIFGMFVVFIQSYTDLLQMVFVENQRLLCYIYVAIDEYVLLGRKLRSSPHIWYTRKIWT